MFTMITVVLSGGSCGASNRGFFPISGEGASRFQNAVRSHSLEHHPLRSFQGLALMAHLAFIMIMHPPVFAPRSLSVSPLVYTPAFPMEARVHPIQITLLVCGKAMKGTENDSDIVRSASSSTFISPTSSIRGRDLDVDIHRYIVGIT